MSSNWKDYLRDPDITYPLPGSVFDHTNWPLLYEMKLLVIRLTERAERDKQSREAQLLEGLVSFLDHVQDHAVDRLDVPRELVFTASNEDHPSNPDHANIWGEQYLWPLDYTPGPQPEADEDKE